MASQSDREILERFKELWDDPDWILVEDPEEGGYSIFHRSGSIKLIESGADHDAVCAELLRLNREVLKHIPVAEVKVEAD